LNNYIIDEEKGVEHARRITLYTDTIPDARVPIARLPFKNMTGQWHYERPVAFASHHDNIIVVISTNDDLPGTHSIHNKNK